MLKTAMLISVLFGSLLFVSVARAEDDESFRQEEFSAEDSGTSGDAEASGEAPEASYEEASEEPTEETSDQAASYVAPESSYEEASEEPTEEASDQGASSVETAAAETNSAEAENSEEEANPSDTARESGAGESDAPTLDEHLAAGAASAATPPGVAEILDRYIAAAGGRTALEKLKSRVTNGVVEVSTFGLSGSFQAWAQAPNKQASKLEFAGLGAIREGYDGAVAWAEAPGLGARVKSGSELSRIQRSTAFPRELTIQDAYARLEAKGASKIGDLDVWVIEAFPEEGKPVRLSFDQKTGLLVQEESTVETPAGEKTFQTDLGDYRDVDGVKVAFSIKVPKPFEIARQVRITEVKHNVDIADTEFAMPHLPGN